MSEMRRRRRGENEEKEREEIIESVLKKEKTRSEKTSPGRPPAQIKKPPGRPPAQIKKPRGRPPTQIKKPPGRPPAQAIKKKSPGRPPAQATKKPRGRPSSNSDVSSGRKRKLVSSEIKVGDIVTLCDDGSVGRIMAIYPKEKTFDISMVLNGQRLKKVDCNRFLIGDESASYSARRIDRYKMKVDTFLNDHENTVLKVDELIDKKNKNQVKYLLESLLKMKKNQIQIAFFQGTIPLEESQELFELFCQWLCKKSIAKLEPSSNICMQLQSQGWYQSGHHYLGKLCRYGTTSKKYCIVAWKPAKEARQKFDKWSPFVAIFAIIPQDYMKGENKNTNQDEYISITEPELNLLDKYGNNDDETNICLWSLNIGEIRFSSQQLIRLADSLAESEITHMFYECNNLFASAFSPQAQFQSPAALEAARNARKGRDGWKDTFRNIIRTNRKKHDLYLFKDHRPKQNAIIHQAVKNWFCPWGHKENKQWLAKHGGIQYDYYSASSLQNTADTERARRRSMGIPTVGDRIELIDDNKKKTKRGTVARVLSQGIQFILAFDDGGCRTINTRASDIWQFENLPKLHDVVRYTWSEAYGMHRLPVVPTINNALTDGVLLTLFSEIAGAEFWYTTETGAIRCPPIQNQIHSDWTIEYPAGSTGAYALRASRREANRSKQVQIPPPSDSTIQVKNAQGKWLEALIIGVGKEKVHQGLPDFYEQEHLSSSSGNKKKFSGKNTQSNGANDYAGSASSAASSTRPKRTPIPRTMFNSSESSTELSKRMREDATLCKFILQHNGVTYKAHLGRSRFNDLWRYQKTTEVSSGPALIGSSFAYRIAPLLKIQNAKSKISNAFLHLVFRDRDDPVRLLQVKDIEWHRNQWSLIVSRASSPANDADTSDKSSDESSDDEDEIDEFDRDTLVDDEEHSVCWRYPHPPLTLFTEKLVALAPASFQSRTCLLE
uniref:Uncharacterized protein n=1 Tax=Aureoumbra lagunensis TaxID=44058 RepID=A0A7S3K128_9STRA